MIVLHPLNRRLSTPKTLAKAFKGGKLFHDDAGESFSIHSFPAGTEVKLIANAKVMTVFLNKKSSIDVTPRRSVVLRIQEGQTLAS